MDKIERYDVVVSDRARQMLGQRIRFLANACPSAAQESRGAILKAIRSLATMPQRFPFIDEPYIPRNKYHKMLVGKWYLVLYQIKDQTVYVDYIIDCRQDYQWLIK